MRKYTSLLVVLAMVLAACGGGDDTSDPSTTLVDGESTATTPNAPGSDTEAPVQGQIDAGAGETSALVAAIAKSGDATSGRMKGTITITGGEGMPSGADFSINFSGAFDNANESSSFVMDLSGISGAMPAGEEIPAELGDLFGEMEIRTIGDTAYMKFGMFAMFGVGTEWVSMSADDAGVTAADFGANPGNPADMLSAFGSTEADIEEIGTETIDGVNTTHFRLTVDAEQMMEAADEESLAELEGITGLPGSGIVPVDFWVGDDGNVYRFSMAIEGGTAAAEGFTAMTMVWDMYDYGADVGIIAPPADQVSDGSSLSGFLSP